MSTINLGNIVALIKSETAPSKKYVTWAKILDPLYPDLVQLYRYDGSIGDWIPTVEGGTLSPALDFGPTNPSALTPSTGDAYLIPDSPSGLWSGKAGYRAEWNGHQWLFVPPFEGVFIKLESEPGVFRLYESGEWIAYQAGSYQFDPVDLISDLRAIDTTDGSIWFDKGTIYVEENNSIYSLDRNDSASVDDNNLIIDPTTGPGRWKKIGSSIGTHNNLAGLQGGTTNEYYHLTSAQRGIVTSFQSALGNDKIFGTTSGGSIAAYNKTDFLVSLGVNHNGLSLAGQVLSTVNASTSQSGILTSTDWNNFNDKADASHTHDAADIVSGTFDDALFTASNITQFNADLQHDLLFGYSDVNHRVIDDSTSSTITLYSSTKIEALISGALSSYQRKGQVLDVLDPTQAPPVSPAGGDRYILNETVGAVDPGWGACVQNDIAVWDSGTSEWISITPSVGWIVFVESEMKDALFVDDPAELWELRTISVTDHGMLSGLGDDDHTQYYNSTRINTWLSTKSTSNLVEGINLYHTDARVRATTLSGYSVGSNVALSTSDTILSAFGKVQAQINAKPSGTGTSGKLTFWSDSTTLDDTTISVSTGNVLENVDTVGYTNLTQYVYFSATQLSLFSEGNNALNFSTINNETTFNVGGENDVIIKSSASNYNVFVDYSSGRIGFNTNTPDREFEFVGDIKLSSGDIYVVSGNNLNLGSDYAADNAFLQIAPASSARANIYLDPTAAADPTSLADGMLWYKAGQLNFRDNGITKNILTNNNIFNSNGQSTDSARYFKLKAGYGTSQYFQVQNEGGENLMKLDGSGSGLFTGKYTFQAASNGGPELNVIKAVSHGNLLKVNVQAEDNQGIIDIYGNQVYQLIRLNSTSTSYFYNPLVIGTDDNTETAKFKIKGSGTSTGISFLQENSSGTDLNKILDNGRPVLNLASTVISDSDLLNNSGSMYVDSGIVKMRAKDNGGSASTPKFDSAVYVFQSAFFHEGGALTYQLLERVNKDTNTHASGFLVPKNGTLYGFSVTLGSSSASGSETLTFTVRKEAVGIGNTGAAADHVLGGGTSVATLSFVSGGILASRFDRNNVSTGIGASVSAGDILYVESSNFALWTVNDVHVELIIKYEE